MEAWTLNWRNPEGEMTNPDFERFCREGSIWTSISSGHQIERIHCVSETWEDCVLRGERSSQAWLEPRQEQSVAGEWNERLADAGLHLSPSATASQGRFQEACYRFLLQTPTSFLLVSSRDPKMWHCVCVSCLVVSDSLQPHMLQPTGPPVHGILQASTLEWVAISFSKSNSRKKESEVAQSCPTLCDPMDRNLPGSSVRGVFQARVLERGASSFPDVTLGFPNSISKMLLFLVCFYFSTLIVLKS